MSSLNKSGWLLLALAEFGGHLFDPTIRLGVTGLSNAGKTVFITALVHGLLRGGRFPVFEAMATGRIARAYLAPQPDYAVPRFDYESHLDALVNKRRWPASTRQISELRLVIEYQSQRGHQRALTLDIVDYPGEWLLDLPLLDKSYEAWAAESVSLSRLGPRAGLAKDWNSYLATLDPQGAEDEQDGADRGKTLHRVSEGLPRQELCDESVAAGAVSHAGRPRQYAGADVCAARCRGRRYCAERLALGA